MLTREQIIRAAETRNRLNTALKAVARRFYRNEAEREAHRDAAFEFHDTRVAADYLWSDETRQQIRSGERESIKDALLFLEVDPWYFRSGYLKERLIDAVKRAPLTERDKERIRQVIISAAGGHNRREFRRYCRLAAVVTTSEFEETLRQMALNPGPRSRGKFSYLLQYLEQHRAR